MTALGTKRNRLTIPLAAVLLLLQGLAGGAVPLVHATERLNAPAHIEAQHGTGCLVLHDELRCALCHYAGSQVVPQQAPSQAPDTLPAARRLQAEHLVRATGSAHLTALPRAPPTPLS